MNIEIRNNVPIPPKAVPRPRGPRKSPVRLITEKLQINQSFEIEHSIKKIQGLYSMCRHVGLDTGRKFTVRRLREGDKKGTAVYGVWRIA